MNAYFETYRDCFDFLWTVPFYGQALAYLAWARFLVERVCWHRQHVVICMDETYVHDLTERPLGMACSARVKNTARLKSRIRRRDRSDMKTAYISLLCDCPELQPHLPQIIMPRFTHGGPLPASFLTKCRAAGAPLEFWHGTRGFLDGPLLRRLAVRLRTVVRSFQPNRWIVLVLDASTVHLNVETLAMSIFTMCS